MDIPWLYQIPGTVLFVVIIAVVAAAAVIGKRIGRRVRAGGGTPAEDGLHGLDNAALGLLALLIGFTLAMALSRFETRRSALLDEANSIGTTWLRTTLQPEPFRSDLDRLLRAYVQVRLDLIRDGNAEAAIARSNAIQNALWQEATKLAAASSQPIMASLFIESLNETIDLQQTRITAVATRVPGVVFLLLIAVAAVASGLAAYSGGLGGGRTLRADLISCLLLASVIVIIIDLDNARGGYIRVNQQPMLALAASMGLKAP